MYLLSKSKYLIAIEEPSWLFLHYWKIKREIIYNYHVSCIKGVEKMLDYILLGGFLGIFMCVIILIMLSNGFIGIVIRTSILIIIFLWFNKIIKSSFN